MVAASLFLQAWRSGKNRMKAIYSEDEHMVLRKSHQNPDVIAIYKEFLDAPNSHKSHELFHTHYVETRKLLNLT